MLKSLHCNTIKELIDYVNEHEIKKEDIVTIMNGDGYYILLYYKY